MDQDSLIPNPLGIPSIQKQAGTALAEEFLRRTIGGITNQRERRSRLSAVGAQGMDISGLQY